MRDLDRIQIVFSRRPDGVSDEDWNTWYDAHLHEILAIPGFVSAQRFAEMIRMSLGTAEAYIELKRTDTTGPPLPPWWDLVRFASWNGEALGERVHEKKT